MERPPPITSILPPYLIKTLQVFLTSSFLNHLSAGTFSFVFLWYSSGLARGTRIRQEIL
jgi:hypothetical protein